MAESYKVPQGQEVNPMGNINVVGTGVVKATPDVADVIFEVRQTAKRCGEAVNGVSEVTSKLHQIVFESFGIDKKDIKTVNAGTKPEWSKEKKKEASKIIGYAAWHITTVRVNDITKLGELLAALTEGGATSFEQSWDIGDKQGLEDKARETAFADATRKALLYAKAAMVPLGKIAELSENQRWNYGGAHAPAMAKQDITMSAMMNEVPMERGEQSITINVNAAFEIASRASKTA